MTIADTHKFFELLSLHYARPNLRLSDHPVQDTALRDSNLLDETISSLLQCVRRHRFGCFLGWSNLILYTSCMDDGNVSSI